MTKEEAQLFIMYLERYFSIPEIKLFWENEKEFEVEFKLESKNLDLYSQFVGRCINLLALLTHSENFSWKKNENGFTLNMHSEKNKKIIKTWNFKWRRLCSEME